MNKGNKCTTCGYLLLTQCSFDNIRSKHDYYRGKDCIKSLYKQKFCYICRNKFNSDSKIHRNVGDHYHYTEKYRGATHLICNLRHKSMNESLVA